MTRAELESIGMDAGLIEGSDHMEVFIEYILARSFDQHHISTAKKWAKRFADNFEWGHSDCVGQDVLRTLRPDKYSS